MKFDTFVFDFDYTLADGTMAIVECYNYALEKKGFKKAEVEPVRKTVGMTVEDSFIILSGCKDEKILTEMRSLFREKADEVLAIGTKMYSDSFSLMHFLKENKVKTAIVSSKQRFRIEEILKRENLIDYFDLIIGFSDAPEPKPSPVGLKLAIEKLNGKKILYAGDSMIDAKTALNADCPFAAILNGTITKDEFLRFFENNQNSKVFGIFQNLTEFKTALK